VVLPRNSLVEPPPLSMPLASQLLYRCVCAEASCLRRLPVMCPQSAAIKVSPGTLQARPPRIVPRCRPPCVLSTGAGVGSPTGDRKGASMRGSVGARPAVDHIVGWRVYCICPWLGECVPECILV
jgi:hypothetical protein